MRFEGENRWLYWGYYLGILISFGVLLTKVLVLGVIQHPYYLSLARDNKVFESTIPAGRGQILDRKGRVIAKSVYQYFKTVEGTKVFEGDGDFQGSRFEGKDLAYDLKRFYPYGESLGFVSGYVGQINEEELKRGVCGQKMLGTSDVGRGGVEEMKDCELRGEAGRRLIEVDARGRYIRELGREEPKIGDNINLSIDAYWQEKVKKIIDKTGKKVAVVMSQPKDGKVLVVVSRPGFDPNIFSYQRDNQAIKSLLEDRENLPLLNRSVAGRYHPGSVFKIAVATAALESGKVLKDELIEDTGIIKVGDYSYTNWLWTKRGGTDGMVNMTKALKRSNDIYFYKVGEKLGADLIAAWAKKMGYGQKTRLGIPGEADGVVPDENWKKETKGERWYLGNTYHYAIGQGDLDVTPIQVNQMTNIVANSGKWCQLSLFKDGKIDCQDLGLKKETVATIKEGMKAACRSEGTAWPLFNFKTELACKTGTAEVGDGSHDTHAWLTAFAPAVDPEISITVVVERGGEGSDVAGPIVGDILKEWFGEPETKVPRYGEGKKIVYE